MSIIRCKVGEICIYCKPQMQHSRNTKKHMYDVVAVVTSLSVHQPVDLCKQTESWPEEQEEQTTSATLAEEH